MKLNLILTTVAMSGTMLLAQSCSSDNDTDNISNNNVSMTFTAWQEGADDDTRTSLSEGKKVLWNSDDSISIFTCSDLKNNKFIINTGAGTTQASFFGTISKPSSKYYAIYPYSKEAKLNNDGYIDGLILPNEQQAVKDGFDPKVAFMVATTTNNSIAFRNFFSLAKITTSEPFKKITISAGDTDIAGLFCVQIPDEGISYNWGEYEEGKGTREITLVPPTGKTYIEPGTYYISLYTSWFYGLNVSCEADEYKYIKTIPQNIKITAFQRNRITNLGEVSTDNGWKKITNDPHIIQYKFSVNNNKAVQFTKGNLYWDGSTFRLESNQIACLNYSGTYNKNHVTHFYWTSLEDYKSGNAAYMPYAENYSCSSQSTTDKFWCGEDNPLTVDGESGLYALSGGKGGEWDYLINGRAHATKLCKCGVTITDGYKTVNNCLVIAPDDYDFVHYPLQDSYTLTEIDNFGLICLPAAGYRNCKYITQLYDIGLYWTSTPNQTDASYSYGLYFKPDNSMNDQLCSVLDNPRVDSAYCLRLVKNLQK